MSRTAFVTGSTGFVGLNLIDQLLRRKWEVIAFYLPNVNLSYLNRYQVTKVSGNIGDRDSIEKALPDGVDAIFHVAGNTSMWSKNDRQQYLDNVIGTQNMVEAAIRKNSKRFIYTSSIAAYGYHGTRIDESTLSNALDCGMNYNKTKFQAEQIVKQASKEGLPGVILNPINMIGPYDMNGWARQFIIPVCKNKLSAIPPGKAMWTHIKDVVDAHINAVDMGNIGENYLLGGVEASFLEVVNEIEKVLGKKHSTKVQSARTLKVLTSLLMLKSGIDGKEPQLTPAKYKRAVGSITCDYSKAKVALDFNTSALNLMICDSCQWLHSENLI